MLLKFNMILLVSFFSFSLYANDWSIVKVDKSYLLKNDKKSFELVYSGKPKLLNTKEEKGFYILDYFSGEYGTTQKSSITRRVVISKDKMIKIADDILSVKEGEETVQSKWEFDSDNNVIKVFDPDLELTKNYPY